MTPVNECEQLVNSYLEWLRQNINTATLGDACEITTPFLDRHNDYLQIYVVQENGHYILSDDSYTLSDLRMSGVEIKTESRQQMLDTILAGLGVSRVDDELRVIAQPSNLGEKKHNLIQAMLAVNDMFMVARPHVFSFFREDVEQFLRTHHVRFVSNINFHGQSGYTHSFDFIIPRSSQKPERVLKAINNPNKETIFSLIFAWNDTRISRPTNSEAIAVLNDIDRTIPGDTLNALESYKITPLSWSQRTQYTEALAS